ncbi:competence pheromone ComX [Paenibacillus sp. GSMTC-2017]|uniref:competence pheromone ComX n=1 Tax=Paenibacillus sp. GSMTC-2017 TaxID=2794350 RepID=UPI0018D6C97E|nr:competence pheromone ComX [Paenibacillus sp. GSMTC-2017]MBH5320029.1 competence pheromone ComX [Paenibacillus sp. GSMTC-2017]
MLKEVIRQLANNSDKMSMFMGGQLHFAGVTVEENRALMGELKDKNPSENGYVFKWH